MYMHRDRHRAVLDHEGFQQGAVDRFRQLDQRPGLVLVGQHHGEFLATDAADHIRFPHTKFEQPRQALDHPIANLMAVLIIDPLKVIDIDDVAIRSPGKKLS